MKKIINLKKKKSQAVKTRLQMILKELYSWKFPLGGEAHLATEKVLQKLCVTQSAVTQSTAKQYISLSGTSTSARTHLLHSLHRWWWILVAAEVNNDPGNIAEEGDGDRRVYERKQGLDHTEGDDIIPALWTITWAGKGQRST